MGEQSITPVERSNKAIRRLTTFKAFLDFMLVVLAALNLFCAILVVVQSYWS